MAALNQWVTESTVAPPVPAPTANPAVSATAAFWTTIPPYAVQWMNAALIAAAPTNSIIAQTIPFTSGAAVIPPSPTAPTITDTTKVLSITPWNAGTTQAPSFPANVAVQITNASPLPPGTHAVAYTAVTFAASGGTSPYTFTQASGTIPAGMTLSAGVLSGTPTTAGTYVFTLAVKDTAGFMGSKSFTLVIA
jgi:hypothetical protein